MNEENQSKLKRCDMGPFNNYKDRLIVWFNKWSENDPIKRNLILVGEASFLKENFEINDTILLKKDQIFRPFKSQVNKKLHLDFKNFDLIKYLLIIIDDFIYTSYDFMTCDELLPKNVPTIFIIKKSIKNTRSLARFQYFLDIIIIDKPLNNDVFEEKTFNSPDKDINEIKEIEKSKDIRCSMI